MATTLNDFKRTRVRYPSKLDNGVDQFVGDVFAAQTNSVDMDTSTEYFAKRSNSSALNSGEWTIMMWMKKEANFTATGNLLLFHGIGYKGTCTIAINSSTQNLINIGVYDDAASGQHTVHNSNFWTTGDWIQLVVTHSSTGDTTEGYKNGVSYATDTDSLVFEAGDKQIYELGTRLNGLVHSFAWFSAVLDDAAVTALYNSGDSNFDLNEDSGNYDNSSDLVLWYRLGHDDTDTDSMGVNYAATGPDYNVSDNSANITTADIVVDAPS